MYVIVIHWSCTVSSTVWPDGLILMLLPVKILERVTLSPFYQCGGKMNFSKGCMNFSNEHVFRICQNQPHFLTTQRLHGGFTGGGKVNVLLWKEQDSQEFNQNGLVPQCNHMVPEVSAERFRFWRWLFVSLMFVHQSSYVPWSMSVKVSFLDDNQVPQSKYQ